MAARSRSKVDADVGCGFETHAERGAAARSVGHPGHEVALYLCRWPNGDCSVVKARDRSEAVRPLDEWGSADPTCLVAMDSCMIDFRLSDRAEIELNHFGEETENLIWEQCYPELEESLSRIQSKYDSGSQNVRASLAVAVQHERTRQWSLRPEQKLASVKGAQNDK